MTHTRIAAALVLATLALAACGGGGGGSPADTGGVPNSAQTSVGGLVAYLQQLIAATNETDSPVSLDGVTLPVDDTAPPSPV